MRSAVLTGFLIGLFIGAMWCVFGLTLNALRIVDLRISPADLGVSVTGLIAAVLFTAPLYRFFLSFPRTGVALVALVCEGLLAVVLKIDLMAAWPFSIGLIVAAVCLFTKVYKKGWSWEFSNRTKPSLRVLPICAALIFLSGCAVGPLVAYETARTVGEGKHEIVGGYGSAGYALKYTYGVTENWDVGVQWESLSMGGRTKYTFAGGEEGWSLAAAGGLGSSVGGSHIYADLIASHFDGKWEPYGAFRMVHVKFDDTQSVKGDDWFSIDLSDTEYTYAQFILGTRYWLDDRKSFSLEVSSPFSDVSAGFIVGAGFSYRF